MIVLIIYSHQQIEEVEKCVEDTKKELISNIIELNKVKEEIMVKDMKIKQLESKLKNEEEENDKLKTETSM